MNLTSKEFRERWPHLVHLVDGPKKSLPAAKCAAGPLEKMNKLERDYANHLETLKVAGEVVWWAYEMYTFKFAPDLRYTPDFSVLIKSHVLEFHETKGDWWDGDSKVKVRLAAATVPHPFRVVTRRDGQWSVWDVPSDWHAESWGIPVLEKGIDNGNRRTKQRPSDRAA